MAARQSSPILKLQGIIVRCGGVPCNVDRNELRNLVLAVFVWVTQLGQQLAAE
jgi:hypothetical protein